MKVRLFFHYIGQYTKIKYLILFSCIILFLGCFDFKKENSNSEKVTITESESVTSDSIVQEEIEVVEASIPIQIQVAKDVPIRSYFKWMDSIVAVHNASHHYVIDEYDIVHFNPWIIDTLANTDYYYLMEEGIFNEDSQALIALKEGQMIFIPDSLQTQEIKTQLSKTHLEMNIPEFSLQIIQDEKELYSFPVRVGKNNTRYLAMAGREVDMRTKPGEGEIVRVNKNPAFINPQNNKRYYTTQRDDGNRTSLPAIPWLEPAIDGVRIGQLIHPTTNLETLGKAVSNGCIGLREADAWIVYYYAPLGTRVHFKYELEGKNEKGETIKFENIYPDFENK